MPIHRLFLLILALTALPAFGQNYPANQERGLEVIASSPEEFTAHVERKQTKWGRVINERGIKARGSEFFLRKC